MKKRFAALILCVVLPLTISACSTSKPNALSTNSSGTMNTVANYQEKNELKIVNNHAIHKNYKDLTELEEKADIIIKGRFTGERNTNVIRGSHGEVDYTNSISTINVSESFTGDVAKDTQIRIYEPGYVSNNTYFNVEGYNLLNENGEYILFLRSSNNGIYSIVGMYQGKFDLKTPNKITNTKISQLNGVILNEYLGDNVEHYNSLKKQVVAKYNDY
ncbi:hypothetical protein H8B09_11335 [Paenibacillus sp. PR3]|uniref:Lipoprotein n=1 Tax=Paenibacillus terricola TaxID=2763503 RepID=A0ABR8MXV5_9BACL|nr:hypothetical protein [Paenibacillus terricola]MBD3919349.1 hypothetical protein [Paenibacillus terricola]